MLCWNPLQLVYFFSILYIYEFLFYRWTREKDRLCDYTQFVTGNSILSEHSKSWIWSRWTKAQTVSGRTVELQKGMWRKHYLSFQDSGMTSGNKLKLVFIQVYIKATNTIIIVLSGWQEGTTLGVGQR